MFLYWMGWDGRDGWMDGWIIGQPQKTGYEKMGYLCVILQLENGS